MFRLETLRVIWSDVKAITDYPFSEGDSERRMGLAMHPGSVTPGLYDLIESISGNPETSASYYFGMTDSAERLNESEMKSTKARTRVDI